MPTKTAPHASRHKGARHEPPAPTALPLPHERDEALAQVDPAPRAEIVQAKRDLDAGLVDTDMRATPGLDAERRARLVPVPVARPAPRRR